MGTKTNAHVYARRAVVAMTACMLFVAGCGSDTKKGVFLGGAVSGLHYETATQSGLTDEDGTFRYKSGETVTFSLGDVVLGSAPGARDLSPFDLVGIEAPSTESALRTELATYASGSAFDRAANIMYLLVALDADGHPENGIDLTGRDESLVGANIPLHENLYNFEYRNQGFFRRQRAVFGLRLGLNRPLLLIQRMPVAPFHRSSFRKRNRCYLDFFEFFHFPNRRCRPLRRRRRRRRRRRATGRREGRRR